VATGDQALDVLNDFAHPGLHPNLLNGHAGAGAFVREHRIEMARLIR
jgi:hypothetical protein